VQLAFSHERQKIGKKKIGIKKGPCNLKTLKPRAPADSLPAGAFYLQRLQCLTDEQLMTVIGAKSTTETRRKTKEVEIRSSKWDHRGPEKLQGHRGPESF